MMVRSGVIVVVSTSGDYQIIARPNRSLSSRGMVKVVALIALFSLVVAIGFSLAGAWLVLPFAGLELLALAYAFYYINCHAGDYESITIAGDQLAVEKRNYKNTSQVVFSRYWARVLLRELPSGDQSLLLRSHGKEIEFGRNFMNNDQRLALAQQLKKRVGAVL
ncbi:MAG TPA: DUF2244 domain-containing protein [Methylophilaceae bacterium]|nr:DUF2244 domain-containing protein [Methylophilaceae bacterium]